MCFKAWGETKNGGWLNGEHGECVLVVVIVVKWVCS